MHSEMQAEGGRHSHRLYPLWLITLISGLAAGSLAGVAGEFIYDALYREPHYPASIEILGSSARSIARAQVRFQTKKAMETNEAAVAFGVLGAALGLGLGLAGGLTGGSRRSGLSGAAVGCGLGTVAGAGLSMVFVPLFFQLSNATTSAPLLLLTHAVIFAGVGSSGGAALGWAWGIRKALVRCVIGGLLGALVGTVFVDIINVATSGIMRVFEPVPAETLPRLLIHLGVATSAAIGASIAGRKLRPR